jgi:hypothetical protein
VSNHKAEKEFSMPKLTEAQCEEGFKLVAPTIMHELQKLQDASTEPVGIGFIVSEVTEESRLVERFRRIVGDQETGQNHLVTAMQWLVNEYRSIAPPLVSDSSGVSEYVETLVGGADYPLGIFLANLLEIACSYIAERDEVESKD